MTIEEARVIVNEWTKELVAKWDKTGLLDSLHDDITPCQMSVLIESEPKMRIEQNMTKKQKRIQEAFDMVLSEKKVTKI